MKRIRYLLAALALPFAALLTHAAITGQSPVTTLQRASAAVMAVVAPLPIQGPGLGNLQYNSSELFTAVSMIHRDDQGVPET